MFDRLRAFVLRFLRVPPDPDPPAGATGSVRVFRAGRNFFKLRLAAWGLGQVGALIGIVISLGILDRLERGAEEVRHEIRQAAAREAAAERGAPSGKPAGQPAAEARETAPDPPKAAPGRKTRPRGGLKQRLGRTAERWPMWVFPLLKVLEWGGVMLYLIQIPVTYALARLDYELRWYMVTDRSLRIRSGVATVQETTMSFANVQQVMVTQGPLQRLLGVANVQVQSAGGGGGDAHQAAQGNSAHSGVFQGVDNAAEIRHLILARLRQFREAGLGDPDELNASLPAAALPSPAAHAALAAANELLEEARALRSALVGREPMPHSDTPPILPGNDSVVV